MTIEVVDDAYKPEVDDLLVPLTQAELNNLTQDLNLSKKYAQLLVSHLKEKHLLLPGTTFYRYRDCESGLRQFLSHHWFIATTLLD